MRRHAAQGVRLDRRDIQRLGVLSHGLARCGPRIDVVVEQLIGQLIGRGLVVVFDSIQDRFDGIEVRGETRFHSIEFMTG